MKKFLMLLFIAISLNAKFVEVQIVEEAKYYTIYCIKGTLWLKWVNNQSSPVQMLDSNRSAHPVDCR